MHHFHLQLASTFNVFLKLEYLPFGKILNYYKNQINC